ncbi:MAG TPA: EAL domain-containing protein [Arenimonas sp.]|uniref:EAL domain-containing protein n=1 Tax=Arenimonas sp. TaxID=1872635 RepID=UPI002D806B4E|nr:EAL domain-containing protein [Arenimonas sp.]HEU0152456.1 EAL domain-containing protein [Arenimonas sp.]
MMRPIQLRVLVVDDDEEDFLILRDLLADFPAGQFTLEWVPTLAQGVAALRAGSYDVYLVDYLLGPDNGLDLVRLAVAEGSAHRPVIMLTGQGNDEVDREALDAGAADYLIKGNIDGEKLARSLRYAAERARHVGELDEARARYQMLFNRTPFPSWVYDVGTLRFLAVNDAMVERYGYSRDELAGMGIADIRSPAEAQRLRAYLAGTECRDGFVGVWQHQRKDGGTLWVEITSHALQFDGRACRQVIAVDISERRTAQERLQLLERAVESSINGVVITDPRQPDNPIIYVNPAFEEMTGYTAAEAMGRNCRFLQDEATSKAEVDIIRAALREERDCNVMLSNRRKDGSHFWNHLFISPVRDDEGHLVNYVAVQNDLTERHRVEAELAYTASHDAVTGLQRFPVLESTLGGMLDQEGAVVSVLFIDIDHFHAINESMGHLIGDEALQVLAERIGPVVGGRGYLSRFAGDEFVAIAPGLDSAGALALADRLRTAVALPIEGDGYKLFLTASIGISRSPEHGDSGMELLRRAEAAMTRAKRQGRDSICEFSATQMQELEDRLVLGARLREAIARDELSLHYQPQLAAADLRITGFEALVRWTSPDLGPVPPGRFIPIAESLGLMPEVGLWVLNEACRQLRAWRDQGRDGFTVAVNFSAQQLQRPDVVAQVAAALARHGVPATMLEIELTESSLMENVERVQGRLAELKALGVSLSLDDFGTGYSSLSYLREFSLDKLKIDRSFVKDLPESADDAVIARTIVAMAHQLRMRVAAEGVEDEAQAAFLRQIGCDELQGYHFGRPVPADEIDRRFPRD